MSLSGVIVCAISVGIFKLAAFGVDPFQAFMSGIDQLIPIDFGTLYVIVNACLLVFALLFDRHYIGLATFINLFLLGFTLALGRFLWRFFLFGAAFVVFSFITMFFVKHGDSKPEKKSNLEALDSGD